MCQSDLGLLLAELGQRHEAEAAFHVALTIQEKLVADFPTVLNYRRDLANTQHKLGLLLRGAGQQNDAEAAYRAALAIQEKLAAESPNEPQFRQQLAITHNDLGQLLCDLAGHREAEAAYDAALAIEEKLAADSPYLPQHRQVLAITQHNRGSLLARQGRHREAEAAFRTAIAAQEKLVADFPNVPRYGVELGGTYGDFGKLHRDAGQSTDALEWYDKSVLVLADVLARDERLIKARESLRDAHSGRARTFDQLKCFADAASDWGRAIELDEGPSRRQLRIRRAASLAQAGDHATAVSEANEVARDNDLNADELYNLACVCSLATAAAKPADPNANPDSETLNEQYAGRALELLHRAVATGFNDAARLKRDSELDALRERDDFKQLIAALEAKQKE